MECCSFHSKDTDKRAVRVQKNAATISRCLSASLSLPLSLTVVIISNAYRAKCPKLEHMRKKTNWQEGKGCKGIRIVLEMTLHSCLVM